MRHPTWYWPIVAALSAAATFGFLAALPHDGALWDFGSFHLSGYAANRGMNPYGSDAQSAYAAAFHVTTTVPNLNPPVSVPVFQLLATIDPTLAFRLWWGVSLAIQGLSVAWLVHRGPGDRFLRALWAVGLAGFWMNLGLGQIYAPLLALTVIAYRWLDERPVLAGVCIGVIVAWKPNFGLWPLFLLAARYRWAACSAFATASVLSAVPVLLLGIETYHRWVVAMSGYSRMHVATNVSVTAWLLAALGMPRVVAAAGTVAVAVSARQLMAKPPASSICSDFAIALAIALSPISWAGYTLMLLPAFLRRSWTPAMTLSAALFTIPANPLWQWSAAHPNDIFGPRILYPLAILLLMMGLLGKRPTAGTP